MIALALLLLLQQAQPAPAASPTAPARVSPIDWDSLDALPFRFMPQVTKPMSDFVAHEMRRHGCKRPPASGGRRRLQADVAVLVGAGETLRAVIPRAIDCPTVEQYAAGLVLGFARNNLNGRYMNEGGWYRATLTFDMPE